MKRKKTIKLLKKKTQTVDPIMDEYKQFFEDLPRIIREHEEWFKQMFGED